MIRRDDFITIYKGSEQVYKAPCSVDDVSPDAAGISEAAADTVPKMKLMLAYTRQLDDVLSNPTKHRYTLARRKASGGDIIKITQTANLRYVVIAV